MRPEEEIEKRFVKKCKAIGIESKKLNLQGEKGWPDQTVLLPGGQVMFFEFKRPGGGTVSEHQKERIKKLDNLCFDAEVVDSWEYPLQKGTNFRF